MIYLIKVIQSSRKFNIPVQEHEYNRIYLIAKGKVGCLRVVLT